MVPDFHDFQRIKAIGFHRVRIPKAKGAACATLFTDRSFIIPRLNKAFRNITGIAKLLVACRKMLLVCKSRHHLDGAFYLEAERVSSGMAV